MFLLVIVQTTCFTDTMTFTYFWIDSILFYVVTKYIDKWVLPLARHICNTTHSSCNSMSLISDWNVLLVCELDKRYVS
jgi:hypothetical protein